MKLEFWCLVPFKIKETLNVRQSVWLVCYIMSSIFILFLFVFH